MTTAREPLAFNGDEPLSLTGRKLDAAASSEEGLLP